jgi:tRNA(Ile)-lysidine synthase
MDGALDADEFAAALDPLGPFERAPHLAVAVSGGRDSLALALLAADWVRRRDGRITALIVDHRLRPESAAEAQHVAALLARHGIAAQLLTWRDDKPQGGLAEAARAARYRLLQGWCAQAGVLHLLLAHQRDDQAEAVLMRLGRGSGMDGLAGMASARELGPVRLLRPLLDVPRRRLTATLRARGIAWVDDPSNANLRYLRPRLRQAASEASNAAAAALAGRFAALRGALERRLATIAVERVTLHPAGWAAVDGLPALPEQIGLRLLSALVGALAGAPYRPRRTALVRALQALRDGRGATAGGCRLVPRRDRCLVTREWGAIVDTIELAPSMPGMRPLRWDHRFDLVLPPGAHGTVAALGEAGRLAALGNPDFAPDLRESLAALPVVAVQALPGLWRDGQVGRPDGLVAVGLATMGHGGRPGGRPATLPLLRGGRFVAVFRPDRPLAAAPHALVLAGQHLI